ncbi:MAG TPA: acylphosphatase, partial [Acidimicrobiia bacterium]|nr:acylphosphatase [Acidimicrobiia bacterium]
YEVLKGAVEYLLVAKGGKSYETVFVTDVTPEALLKALLELGAKPGAPASVEKPPAGTPVRIFVEVTVDGKTVRTPADTFILHAKTGKPLDPVDWTFTGSRRAFDPATDREVVQAAVTKSLVGLHWTDASPLVQNARPEARTENLYRANVAALPAAGTPVRLDIALAKGEAKPAAELRRVHLFISGRVQGVGFRNFTQRSARELDLTGWVQNLRDGRVEAVVEGKTASVAKLLELVRRGPRAARVDDIKLTDEKPTGEFETFEVRYPRE